MESRPLFRLFRFLSAINSGAGTVSTLIPTYGGTRTTTGFVGGQTSSGGIFTPTDSSMSWTTLAKTSGLTGIGNTNSLQELREIMDYK